MFNTGNEEMREADVEKQLEQNKKEVKELWEELKEKLREIVFLLKK